MAQTPSHRRRQGRNAYVQGDLIDDCPYKNDPWWEELKANDWKEGWREAEKMDEINDQLETEFCELCGRDLNENNN